MQVAEQGPGLLLSGFLELVRAAGSSSGSSSSRTGGSGSGSSGAAAPPPPPPRLLVVTGMREVELLDLPRRCELEQLLPGTQVCVCVCVCVCCSSVDRCPGCGSQQGPRLP